MRANCFQRWQALGALLGFTLRDQRSAQLFDVLFLGPFCVVNGILFHALPLNVRISFIVAGVTVIVWNAVNIILTDRNPPLKDPPHDQGS